MIKPNYCPNCGMKFTELIFNHRKKDEITVPAKGWGVECINCEWSGEISPDIQ
jgi:hypothetical protein